jgi:hypothetical protein
LAAKNQGGVPLAPASYHSLRTKEHFLNFQLSLFEVSFCPSDYSCHNK